MSDEHNEQSRVNNKENEITLKKEANYRYDFPTEVTDMGSLDPEKSQKVLRRHNYRSTAYKGDMFPNFFPRISPKGIPSNPEIDTALIFTDDVDMDCAEWFKEWENFNARPDDVIVSSYPKSGHHWMNEIVHMMMTGTIGSSNTNKLSRFVEKLTVAEMDSIPSPRILLTHLKYEHMPKDVFDKGCKIIYVYRNPKDVAVSYFHHTKNLPQFYGFDGTWTDFFDLIIDGDHEYGHWMANVPHWWKHAKNNPNFVFITFEQLKQNFIPTAKNIAGFLGKSYDDDFYEKLMNECSIEVMRTNKKLDVARLMNSSLDRQKACGLIRKGQVGKWKNYFTVAQNEQYDKVYNKVMKDYPDLVVEFE